MLVIIKNPPISINAFPNLSHSQRSKALHASLIYPLHINPKLQNLAKFCYLQNKKRNSYKYENIHNDYNE